MAAAAAKLAQHRLDLLAITQIIELIRANSMLVAKLMAGKGLADGHGGRSVLIRGWATCVRLDGLARIFHRATSWTRLAFH